VSSLAGRNAFPNAAAYCASKHAVNGFSEALFQEVREDGIRVTYLMPGSVATEFGRGADAKKGWALQPDLLPQALDELRPDGEPEQALAAIAGAAPLASPVLVVAHMPLVGLLARELVGEDILFSPGTFVEIERNGDGQARLLRRIGPRHSVG